jgi:hypothetical protein
LVRHPVGIVSCHRATVTGRSGRPCAATALIALFDNYDQAIAAGKFQDALAIRTAETRTRAQKEMSTAKSRQEFLAMAKLMIPDKLEGGGL